MSFSSVTTSPNGTVTAPQSKRVKPMLSLSYAFPNPINGELSVNQASERTRRPISPALIPIPSPVFGPNLAPWKTGSNDGNDNLTMPKAPHLSRSKDAFSPLPLTPGTADSFGAGGLFDALQKEYLDSQHNPQEKPQETESQTEEHDDEDALLT